MRLDDIQEGVEYKVNCGVHKGRALVIATRVERIKYSEWGMPNHYQDGVQIEYPSPTGSRTETILPRQVKEPWGAAAQINAERIETNHATCKHARDKLRAGGIEASVQFAPVTGEPVLVARLQPHDAVWISALVETGRSGTTLT